MRVIDVDVKIVKTFSFSSPPPSCIDQRKQEELCTVFWFVGLAD